MSISSSSVVVRLCLLLCCIVAWEGRRETASQVLAAPNMMSNVTALARVALAGPLNASAVWQRSVLSIPRDAIYAYDRVGGVVWRVGPGLAGVLVGESTALPSAKVFGRRGVETNPAAADSWVNPMQAKFTGDIGIAVFYTDYETEGALGFAPSRAAGILICDSGNHLLRFYDFKTSKVVGMVGNFSRQGNIDGSRGVTPSALYAPFGITQVFSSQSQDLTAYLPDPTAIRLGTVVLLQPGGCLRNVTIFGADKTNPDLGVVTTPAQVNGPRMCSITPLIDPQEGLSHYATRNLLVYSNQSQVTICQLPLDEWPLCWKLQPLAGELNLWLPVAHSTYMHPHQPLLFVTIGNLIGVLTLETSLKSVLQVRPWNMSLSDPALLPFFNHQTSQVTQNGTLLVMRQRTYMGSPPNTFVFAGCCTVPVRMRPTHTASPSGSPSLVSSAEASSSHSVSGDTSASHTDPTSSPSGPSPSRTRGSQSSTRTRGSQSSTRTRGSLSLSRSRYSLTHSTSFSSSPSATTSLSSTSPPHPPVAMGQRYHSVLGWPAAALPPRQLLYAAAPADVLYAVSDSAIYALSAGQFFRNAANGSAAFFAVLMAGHMTLTAHRATVNLMARVSPLTTVRFDRPDIALAYDVFRDGVAPRHLAGLMVADRLGDVLRFIDMSDSTARELTGDSNGGTQTRDGAAAANAVVQPFAIVQVLESNVTTTPRFLFVQPGCVRLLKLTGGLLNTTSIADVASLTPGCDTQTGFVALQLHHALSIVHVVRVGSLGNARLVRYHFDVDSGLLTSLAMSRMPKTGENHWGGLFVHPTHVGTSSVSWALNQCPLVMLTRPSATNISIFQGLVPAELDVDAAETITSTFADIFNQTSLPLTSLALLDNGTLAVGFQLRPFTQLLFMCCLPPVNFGPKRTRTLTTASTSMSVTTTDVTVTRTGPSRTKATASATVTPATASYSRKTQSLLSPSNTWTSSASLTVSVNLSTTVRLKPRLTHTPNVTASESRGTRSESTRSSTASRTRSSSIAPSSWTLTWAPSRSLCRGRCSTTVNRTVTVALEVPEAPVEVMLRQAAAVSEATSAVSISAAIASNPSAALQASRATAVIALAQMCLEAARNATAPPRFPIAVLPFVGRTGTPELAPHRGAVLGNVTFVVGCAFVLSLCASVWALVARSSSASGGGAATEGPLPLRARLSAKLDAIRWPGILLVPVCLTIEGVTASAFTLVVSTTGEDAAVDGVLFGLSLVLVLGVMLCIGLVSRRSRQLLHVTSAAPKERKGKAGDQGHAGDGAGPPPYHASADVPSCCSWTALMGLDERWEPVAGAAAPPMVRRFNNMYGIVFSKYHGPRLRPAEQPAPRFQLWREALAPYFCLFDFTFLVMCSAAKGAAAWRKSACAVSFAIVVLVNAIALLFVVIIRPFLSPLKNALTAASASVSTAAAVVMVSCVVFENHAGMTAAAVLAVLSAVVASLTGFVTIVQRIHQLWTMHQTNKDLDRNGAGGEGEGEGATTAAVPFSAALLLAASDLQVVAAVRPEADDAEMSAVTKSPNGKGMNALDTGGIGGLPSPAPSAERKVLISVDDDDDDDLFGRLPAPKAAPAQGGPTVHDADDLLDAMIRHRPVRVVNRHAEGKAKHDELHSLLNASDVSLWSRREPNTTHGSRTEPTLSDDDDDLL